MSTRCWTRLMILYTSLFLSGAAFAQNQTQTSTLVVNGQSGELAFTRIDRRTFVDLESLARIAKGSVQILGDKITLTVPCSSFGNSPVAPPETTQPTPTGLSPEFMKSSVEALAEMREWASTLAYAIQNGYGVTDSWVAGYRDQAANSVHLAGAAASTESDHNAMRLLTHEFEAVKDWSDKLVEAKNRMDVGKYALSPSALRDDPASQKIIRCGRFLASMLGSGTFQDDPTCH